MLNFQQIVKKGLQSGENYRNIITEQGNTRSHKERILNYEVLLQRRIGKNKQKRKL